MIRSVPGFGRAVLGTLVSVVAIVLVLQAVDLETTVRVLGTAAPVWVAAVVGFIALDVFLRAIRWQRLLAPIRPLGVAPVLGYMLVGYLANNVLPARLGELVRSHYLGDREGMSRTTTLGTVVVERVVDTAVVVAIAAVAILVLGVRGVVTDAILVGGAIAALLVVGLAVAVVAHRVPGSGTVIRALGRWPAFTALGVKLQSGLAVAARPRTLGETLVLSTGAWAATLLAFAAAGHAIGIELRVGEAALLSAGVALASAIPSGPGYLGTYELAAVAIGRALGIPPETAFAMALIVHATIIVLTSLGGIIALARLGWRRPYLARPVAETGSLVASPADADEAR